MESITTPLRTRYIWIDLIKFISITLVVYRHCPPIAYNLTSSIPLFFFISGLLFDFKKYPSFSAFVKHRSKQLIVPYFCFFALFYLFWLFAGRSLSSAEEQALPLYAPLLEYLYGRPVSVCTPLWFVACLFAMQCLFYLFKHINRIITTVILLLLPFLPCLIDISDSPWMLDDVCRYFPFYGIAYLYKKEFYLFIENRKRYLSGSILLIICLLSGWLLTGVSNEYLKTAIKLLHSFSLFLPFALLIKSGTGRFGIHSLIKYIVPNTIIILACHTYVIRLADIFITQVFGQSSDIYDGNFLYKLGMTLFIMISMIVPIYIINRYFPFIIGKGRLFQKREIL